eukprot:4715-Chlamydomonas_euryale.AAC.2
MHSPFLHTSAIRSHSKVGTHSGGINTCCWAPFVSEAATRFHTAAAQTQLHVCPNPILRCCSAATGPAVTAAPNRKLTLPHCHE